LTAIRQAQIKTILKPLAELPQQDVVAIDLLSLAVDRCLVELGGRVTIHLLNQQFLKAMKWLGEDHERAERARRAGAISANIERRVGGGEAADQPAEDHRGHR
jgi:hypothetical protein